MTSTGGKKTNGTKQILLAVLCTMVSTVFGTLWASQALGYSTLERRQDKVEDCIDALRETNVMILTKLTRLEVLLGEQERHANAQNAR